MNPINLPILMLLLTTWAGIGCLAFSPEALEALARKMRARARAIAASRKCWILAYRQSIGEDILRDRERETNILIQVRMEDLHERKSLSEEVAG